MDAVKNMIYRQYKKIGLLLLLKIKASLNFLQNTVSRECSKTHDNVLPHPR